MKKGSLQHFSQGGQGLACRMICKNTQTPDSPTPVDSHAPPRNASPTPFPANGSIVMKNRLSSGLVYSTDSGRMCPACRQPQARCICRQVKPVLSSDGIVRVSRETKGRGGKSVTVIKGVPLPEAGLVQLGKQLKAACGSGGTVKEGVIEVQGDHLANLIELLKKQGFTVKQAGG